ncbi:unnamed protein product [Rangifer tarandus platyrhynchus]|uniref:non-specific serine/threonine protein kinase n=1 Tax=Rangifer tarandus platyrhynchus TaxID=3082113 RepID=A0ABN8XI82_RANTA|nr:unnamed protein product [Rangifer tarandus platyrhynchus]
MRLNAELLRYMTKEEFRVLTSVEMGHKNHEFVPVALIQSIACLKRHSIQDIITSLLKNKLLYRTNQKYEGLKLTYLGYDYLALHAFVRRGLLSGVGVRIGVGKESDIHICRTTDGRVVVLKLHRLGRISFRSIKRNRDYLQRRQHASWMYLARLAALKEFFYLKALYAHRFPVPEPIDVNRHAVVMEYIDATPFREVKALPEPMRVLEKLMHLIVRLGRAGLIHGDFNEFNLMIDDKEHITFIDLPQVVSTQHPNAEMYFERDVECIRSLFARKFNVEVTEAPRFHVVCQASPVAGIADAGSVTEQRGECDTTHSERPLRVEEVLGAEELQAIEEAWTESRRMRDENTENGRSCPESPSDTDCEAKDDAAGRALHGKKQTAMLVRRIDLLKGTIRVTIRILLLTNTLKSLTILRFAVITQRRERDTTVVNRKHADVRLHHPNDRDACVFFRHDPNVVRKRAQRSEKKKSAHAGLRSVHLLVGADLRKDVQSVEFDTSVHASACDTHAGPHIGQRGVYICTYIHVYRFIPVHIYVDGYIRYVVEKQAGSRCRVRGDYEAAELEAAVFSGHQGSCIRTVQVAVSGLPARTGPRTHIGSVQVDGKRTESCQRPPCTHTHGHQRSTDSAQAWFWATQQTSVAGAQRGTLRRYAVNPRVHTLWSSSELRQGRRGIDVAQQSMSKRLPADALDEIQDSLFHGMPRYPSARAS